MPDHGSVIPRRLLAAELKKLRDESGKTLEELQQELLISTSKLSRLENAQGLPQLRDIRDLARFYGLDAGRQAELERWVEESRRTPWWREVDATIPTATADYLSFESAAVEVHAYTARYIPSLLQTPAYARAQIKAINHPEPSELDALVELRMTRKQILARPHRPASFDVVIDESALLRRIGSGQIMSDQLNAIAAAAKNPHRVRPRVLELSSGPSWASHHGSFSVFRFPDGVHPDVANPDDVDKYLDDPQQVGDFLDRYDRICDAAASLEESVALLRTAARAHLTRNRR